MGDARLGLVWVVVGCVVLCRDLTGPVRQRKPGGGFDTIR